VARIYECTERCKIHAELNQLRPFLVLMVMAILALEVDLALVEGWLQPDDEQRILEDINSYDDSPNPDSLHIKRDIKRGRLRDKTLCTVLAFQTNP
jgi:hypothetical protein